MLVLTTGAGHTMSKTLPPASVCAHAPAATQNVLWRVTFTGSLTLTWTRNSFGSLVREQEEGNLTWQAASLAVASPTARHACPSGLCIDEPVSTTGKNVDLTVLGPVDWTHWGGVVSGGEVAPWYVDVKDRSGGSIFDVSLLG